jgi:hypothetical protein
MKSLQAFTVAVVATCAFVCVMSGCKEEPTIVIKFEPNDMTGAAAKTTAATAALGEDGGVAVVAKTAPAPHFIPECKEAADCAVVPKGCCGCNNGGAQEAVAKAKQFAQQAAMKSRCAKTMCPMMMSQDASCAQTVACVESHCVLTGGLPATKPKAKPKK